MPAKFTFRIAMPEDEASVGDLLKASYSALMLSSYDEAVLAGALPMITRANPSLLSAGTYYVAESEEGVIVGCGGWTRERPDTTELVPGLGHIRHFATHPSWIGRGVGRSIYAMCEEQARSAGLWRLECYSSLNAEGFYAALGFRSIRQIEVPMGQGVALPGVLMQRCI